MSFAFCSFFVYCKYFFPQIGIINTIIKVLFLARLMFSFCFVFTHLCDVPVITDFEAVSGLGDVCSVNRHRTVHGLHTLRQINWLHCSQGVFALQSVHVLVCAFCHVAPESSLDLSFCTTCGCKRHRQPCTVKLTLTLFVRVSE